MDKNSTLWNEVVLGGTYILKAGIISLGCAKNLVDTEVMLGLLKNAGIEITDTPNLADVLIVNTCGFIQSAQEESINTILQMAEYKKTGKCRALIVTGCLAQRFSADLEREMPEIDALLGTNSWPEIIKTIDHILAGQRVVKVDTKEMIYDHTMPRVLTTPAYSAYVKIAEGCSNCCSYCVIPLIRGKFRSRPQQSIIAEIKKLVGQGVKEINLIAQDTTSYGKDLYGTPRLVELLQELVKIEPLKWIRILYCYPKYFSDELIDLMAKEDKICSYVDLPLQHADNTVLQAMNRQDTREDIETLLAKIRKRIPGVTVRSTFIVGYPGETAEQFENLKQFIAEQKFDRVGVFTYSQEAGTVAGKLANQIPEKVKEERFHQLMALQSKISEEINQHLEEQTVEVLVEGRQPEQKNTVYGRSYREAPDVDGTIYVENAENVKAGEFITAKIVQGFTYDLLAEKIDK